MIGIEHNGKTYRLVFKHFTRKSDPGTLCTVQVQDGVIGADTPQWKAVAVGSTRRHPNDQLNRPIGRELAMLRALRLVSRELRGQLLRAYYRRERRRKDNMPDWAKALFQREREKWNDPRTAQHA